MNRMKGILAAGTLTGVIVLTILVFGFGSTNAQSQEASTAQDIVVQPVVMPDNSETAVTNSAELQSLQDYNQQLEAALQVMQDREAVYQAQIEQANRTVLGLQDQLNAQIQSQPAAVFNQAAPSAFSSHENHESESHEGFEHDDD